MHKCRACRRPLTNSASIAYGLGPDCLRKAVKAGTAPLEALEEFTVADRANKRAKRTKSGEQLKRTDTKTPDLFDNARSQAIEALRHAVAECMACGVVVTYTIED